MGPHRRSVCQASGIGRRWRHRRVRRDAVLKSTHFCNKSGGSTRGRPFCVGPVFFERESFAIRQVAALCHRLVDGRLEVLLVTSRDTGRWVIPKGNLMRGVNASGAAAIEANEEAGAVGPIAEEPIGIYRYDKRLEDGSAIPAMVDVFPLEVAELHDHWQEMDERTRKWVTPAEAADMVDEPDLQAILRAFRP